MPNLAICVPTARTIFYQKLFISLCLGITLCELTLRNLSLGYERASLQEETRFEGILLERGGVTLESVSADFIASLFALVNVSPWVLTIERCSLPEETPGSTSCTLILKNIPHNPVQSSSGTTNFGLFLAKWSGWIVEIYSCPSFDDDLLYFLATSRYFKPDEVSLTDCCDFTPHVFQKYIEIRNKSLSPDSYKSDIHVRPFIRLYVQGRCPVLSLEDKKWFRMNTCAEFLDVYWDDNLDHLDPVQTVVSRRRR